MRASSGHRPDIDGLRAVAVMSVVLYHLGTPRFDGGFSGVDVFFVISGFLIGGHIAEEISAGRFSLIGFYERRIRRIVPALFAVLALVLIVGAVILFPPDFQRLVGIAVTVVEMRANVRISQTLGDYSGSFAKASPLLHTWSLSVEEQFYLVLPLLMLAIARFAGRRYVQWLTPLALLSFLASVIAARVEPIKDFYLPWFRAWELLLGALVALGPHGPPTSGKVRGLLALAGLVLIGLSDVLISPDDPLPSEYALLACGGAVLILHAECGPRSLAGRLLGALPVRAIGLWSYSLYLIHWPVLIFAHYYLDASLSIPQRIVALAVSIGLAALSWRFVEQPFRNRRLLVSTRKVYIAAGIGVVAVLGLSFGISKGYAGLHPKTQGLFQARTPAQLGCWDAPVETIAARPLCHVGAASAPTAVVWGDSHAQALFPAIEAAFAAHGQSALVLVQSGCPPVMNMELRRQQPSKAFAPIQAILGRGGQRCPGHNAAVLGWIASHRIKTVILAAHWIAYADTAKVPSAVASHLAFVDVTRPESTDEAALFERNFAATLAALQRLGVKVYVAEDDPQQDIHVPLTLAADARLGRPRHHGIARAAYDAQQAVVTGIFARLQQRYGFTLLKLPDVLCATGECVIEQGGRALYQDNEHLSPAGALAVAPALEPLWKTGGAGPG